MNEEFAGLPKVLRALQQSEDEPLWAQAETLAHGLKGVSSNLGAQDIAELATRIDGLVKQRQPAQARTIKALETVMKQAQKSIEGWLASKQSLPVVSHSQVDLEKARAMLPMLLASVRASEYISADRLAAFFSCLPEALTQDQAALELALQNFDFVGAEHLLNQIAFQL